MMTADEPTDGAGGGPPDEGDPADANGRAVERTCRLLAGLDERTTVPAGPAWGPGHER